MRKIFVAFLIMVCMLGLFACTSKSTVPEVLNAYETPFATYYEMHDNTWELGDYTYQYKLEITGRMNNAAKDSTFVYLSNLEDITFDQAWKASGLSSNLDDYFEPEEATLVEMK